ncbi:MAG: Threonine dehydrogenase and related Zn-dependent dehydrogenase [Armatimonadetes bacterium]|nr:Threonine dehydrogenase and related Zn-dependent dehydrogenase [Armatimonadota bacterium]
MRAVVLYGKEDARLEEVPIPEPAAGEVRVRIRAALTCGTDLKVFRRGYHAKMIVPPAIFGHELAGEIDALGAGVTGWQVGDRVVAANSAPCGDCFFCGCNREELCEDLLFLNGAYAEYVVVPERIVRKNLLRLPDGLSFEAAALTEPLACAVHGLEETGVRPGETVVVLGAGPLGLLLVRCAVLAGARVLVAGRREARLRAATALGAAVVLDAAASPTDWVHAHTGGRGADRVIEAVGQPEAWETAISLVRKGGTVNLFGGCPAGTSITVDTSRLHYDALTLLGTFHHTPATIREALRLLAAGAIPAGELIQERLGLDGLPARLPELARGGGPLKVVVTP